MQRNVIIKCSLIGFYAKKCLKNMLHQNTCAKKRSGKRQLAVR